MSEGLDTRHDDPATLWVVWSEEHGGWWRSGGWGYTESLKEAGRFNEAEARLIVHRANAYCDTFDFHEVMMPDPLPGLFGSALK